MKRGIISLPSLYRSLRLKLISFVSKWINCGDEGMNELMGFYSKIKYLFVSLKIYY